MKFKATLEDPKGLFGVLQVCRSIRRGCIIRLQEKRTRFFTNVEVTDGVQVWVGCRTDYLFTDFRLDSSYKEHSITCEVLDLNQLYHVIKQAEARERHHSKAYQTVIRLARTGSQPLLKLSMQGVQGQPDLSYDVPVRILSDREIESMSAPPLEDDRVQVVVPNLTELTTFIDKLKSTSCDSVTFAAQGKPIVLLTGGHKRGRGSTGSDSSVPLMATLVIHAEHFLGSFSLKYDAVELLPQPRTTPHRSRRTELAGEVGEGEGEGVGGNTPQPGDDNDDNDAERDEEEEEEWMHPEDHKATVTVEIKEFARFFSAVKEIQPTRVSMYLVDQSALVLSVYASGNTTMVAYIPAKV